LYRRKLVVYKFPFRNLCVRDAVDGHACAALLMYAHWCNVFPTSEEALTRRGSTCERVAADVPWCWAE
jgi:hypothetical protein